ncbi:UDP-N-acetylglucosamine 2-epimerase, partial [Candidatus Aerophobetes bacterium]|nr:UDP-N-acetylglucosamine 2-epimerase [Candidatus Aerophobetes bacterium]
NFGKPLQNICSAIKWLAEKYIDLIEFVIPVHLNPHVQSVVYSKLGSLSNVDLKPPMDYWIFLSTLKSSYLVLTDSGGVQEETCSFGVPALVLREKTDRQESVKAGFARVVGTDPAVIIKNVEELLFDESKYKRMKALYNPYGDGKASERIHDILNDLVKRRQI